MNSTEERKNEVIPWARPSFWGDESRYVQEALASTWISGGGFLDKLEAYFRGFLSIPHALLVANGTAALHLAYLALDIGPGDEIIVPGFGFLAAANIALHLGAVPVFAEVDPDTWLVTADSIAPCISPRTKAIVVIHTYGQMCDMKPILSLAGTQGIAVIEDTAEALGSSWAHQMAGTLGDVGTFSFQATKTITTGEGGLVVTRRPDLAEKMTLYRSHGLQRRTHYWHDLPGHNFRLTNLQAALGYAQVQHWQEIQRARHRISSHYGACWRDQQGVIPQKATLGTDPVVWAVAVYLRPSVFTISRDQVMAAMRQKGIETRPGFYPPSRHPYFKTQPLPLCEKLAAGIISLPTYAGLSRRQIGFIADALLELRG